MYPDLNDQTFTLNKIVKGKDYFIAKIRQRELMSKGLTKLFFLQQAVLFLLHPVLLLLLHL